MTKMWTLRVQTRDGLERVSLPASSSVEELQRLIETEMKIPVNKQTLSLDKTILNRYRKDGGGGHTSTSSGTITAAMDCEHADDITDLTIEPSAEFSDSSRRLEDIGRIQHGSIVFLNHDVERTAVKMSEDEAKMKKRKSVFKGGKMDVSDLVRRSVRLARQSASSSIAFASFDNDAAGVFQQYVVHTLGFKVPRVGILYGVIGEAEDDLCGVYVHLIFEPKQERNANGGVDVFELEGDERRRFDFIAERLQLEEVGVICAVPKHEGQPKKDENGNGEANGGSSDAGIGSVMPHWVLEYAAAKQKVKKEFVTALLIAGDGSDNAVQLEAFQCSDQCVDLFVDRDAKKDDDRPRALKQGRVGSSDEGPEHPGTTLMSGPVWAGNAETDVVDNDYFIVPIKISSHAGPLQYVECKRHQQIPIGFLKSYTHEDTHDHDSIPIR